MSSERLVHELALRGGVALRSELPFPKRELRVAVEAGVVRRVRRGLYALGDADDALRLARQVSGARSHRSAALVHGFAVATLPRLPEIVVPLGRTVPGHVRRRAEVRWRSISTAERAAAVTDPLTTVVACLRDLGGAEGVAVADSAVRSGLVTESEIRSALATDRGRGVREARRLVGLIDPGAASAFETVLRLLAGGVSGLSMSSQVVIGGGGWRARVDLADVGLGIVAEADSFAWHGSRSALARDARRYDHLSAAGWRVLRFTNEDVFGEPAWVVRCLEQAVEVQRRMIDAASARGGRPWARPRTSRTRSRDVPSGYRRCGRCGARSFRTSLTCGFSRVTMGLVHPLYPGGTGRLVAS